MYAKFRLSSVPDNTRIYVQATVKTELHSESRSGVGPIRNTDDAIERNEMVEGRGRPKFMPLKTLAVETQGLTHMPPHLLRISMAARKSAKTRFTSLLHHVNEAALLRAFLRRKRNASAGIDGTTVVMYENNLAMNLRDLHARIHADLYRPKPVRRAYIPKADGAKRPLGIPTLEDKLSKARSLRSSAQSTRSTSWGFPMDFDRSEARTWR